MLLGVCLMCEVFFTLFRLSACCLCPGYGDPEDEDWIPSVQVLANVLASGAREGSFMKGWACCAFQRELMLLFACSCVQLSGNRIPDN